MSRFLVAAACSACDYTYEDHAGRFWFPRGTTGIGDTFPFPRPPCGCPPNTEYVLAEYRDIDPRIPLAGGGS